MSKTIKKIFRLPPGANHVTGRTLVEACVDKDHPKYLEWLKTHHDHIQSGDTLTLARTKEYHAFGKSLKITREIYKIRVLAHDADDDGFATP